MDSPTSQGIMGHFESPPLPAVLPGTFKSTIASPPIFEQIIGGLTRAIASNVLKRGEHDAFSMKHVVDTDIAECKLGERVISWKKIYTDDCTGYKVDEDWTSNVAGKGRYAIVLIKAENGKIAAGFATVAWTKEKDARSYGNPKGFVARIDVAGEGVAITRFNHIAAAQNSGLNDGKWGDDKKGFNSILQIYLEGNSDTNVRSYQLANGSRQFSGTSLVDLAVFDIVAMEVYSITL